MNMNPNPADSLSAEKMQLFLAGLSDLPEDEVRKAKSLYIRNAISEYKALNQTLEAFGCLQIMFFIVPIFWPFLWMQRKAMNAQRTLYRERIENALEVWADDLEDEYFDLMDLHRATFDL